PAAIRDRAQLLRLRLFKDGDATVRGKQDLSPGVDPPPLRVTMTLQELMGSGGKAPTFSVEYETLAVDGTLSPTQRVAVSPEETTLVRSEERRVGKGGRGWGCERGV